MNKNWSKDIKKHDLSDGYTIERSTGKDFSIYFAVYEIFDTNIWFRQSFDMSCSAVKDCDICFWIKKNGCKIGGVLLEPNYMNCLILEPPNDNEYDIIIAKLKKILLSCSDESKPIIADGVKPDKVKYYQRAGFKIGESRRCMIRPTEKFDVIWNDEYRVTSVRKENKKEIAKFYKNAFKNVQDFQSKLSIEEIERDIQYYFDHNSEDGLVNKASMLVYDRKTNQLIGASLISIWEEWPNVYDFAVDSSFKGKGIGMNMLKHALTILKENYPVLRLFVTLSNDAELFYHKLGFLAGVETTEMIL